MVVEPAKYDPGFSLGRGPGLIFKNREEAGKKLGEVLLQFKGEDTVVLGIPRGGVVIANEVAKALGAPLDIVVTRKIEAPGQPEYGLGAVTQEGDVVLDSYAAESVGAGPAYLEDQIRRKRQEVKERMERLRGDAPYPDLGGKVVLIVDDGIATGSSVEAAVVSIKRRRPKAVVVAAPVAPPDVVKSLAGKGVKVVCLQTPGLFFAIGEFYHDFTQVEDEKVKRILDENRVAPRSTSR